MLHDLQERKTLVWKNDRGSDIELDIGAGSYVFSDLFVFVLSPEHDRVTVYNSNGHIITRLYNSRDVDLIRLENHPVYGPTVVTKIKDGKHKEDTYLTLDGNNFTVAGYENFKQVDGPDTILETTTDEKIAKARTKTTRKGGENTHADKN